LKRTADLVVMTLCFVVPLFLSDRLTTLHTIEDNKWLAVVLLSLTACVLLVLSRAWDERTSRRNSSVPYRSLWIGGIAFAVVHLVAAALSRQPANSLRASMGPTSLILLFSALAWSTPGLGRIRKYLGALVGTAAIVGIIALLQHAGIDPLAALFRFAETDRYRTGVYATLGNPEYLGGYLAPLALVAVGMTLGSRHRRARGAAAVAIALTAIPGLLTGSRGAFLGLIGGSGLFVVASIVMGLRSDRRRRAAMAAAIIVAVTAIAAVFTLTGRGPFRLLRERFAAVANPYGDNIRNRIVFYLVAADVAEEQPILGAGPGMFGPAFYPTLLERLHTTSETTAEIVARDLQGGVPEHVHNDWLEIRAGTGIIGLAVWLWLLAVWIVLVARRLVDKGAPGSDRWILIGLAAALAAVLINALFNFPLHEPVRATVFWILLGTGAAVAARIETIAHKTAVSGSPKERT
jgi:O-antigen ligase